MGLLGSDKSPEQILAEEESEVAEEIWNLINEEEGDLEKLKQIVMENPEERTVNRAENALESLTVAIEKDLETIEDEEETIEEQVESGDFNSERFRMAAEHNLQLLEEITAKLAEDESSFEQFLNQIERLEGAHEEASEMRQAEESLEEDLETLKGKMENGETDFTDRRGWIDLTQFT
jgi:exonuclease VII large subunit